MMVLILFPDPLICQFFQHLNEARMIPSASAGSNGELKSSCHAAVLGNDMLSLRAPSSARFTVSSLCHRPEYPFLFVR